MNFDMLMTLVAAQLEGKRPRALHASTNSLFQFSTIRSI